MGNDVPPPDSGSETTSFHQSLIPMPKKSSKPNEASTSRNTTNTLKTDVVFPDIATCKDWIENEVLLQDQIILFHVCPCDRAWKPIPALSSLSNTQGYLSANECKAYANFIDKLPLELTPPKKRGEALRVNCKPFDIGLLIPSRLTLRRQIGLARHPKHLHKSYMSWYCLIFPTCLFHHT